MAFVSSAVALLSSTQSQTSIKPQHRNPAGIPSSSSYKRVITCSMTKDQNNEFSRRDILQNAMAIAAGVGLSSIASPSAMAADQADPPKLKFTKTDSGLVYADVKKGSGEIPRVGDLVIVDYVGYLSNGTVFDNTKSKNRKPLTFQMGKGKVIKGLEEAVETMKVGGVRKIIVPPALAYGERGVCVGEERKECLIPPNETLEYDVTL
eukprot:CAMPEP_0184703204 /NCGR_PEP_ID=MMETSP0313-20130426/26993_1 /TAXON_ID=2792 /ORGANISM="Porphyridium aerugineum, Strain SAG 1380-2" /LENGTH=206 /DNA_ID=CAMNT_0027163919 /DNA_START=96 /DNA_END=712 /DNA_ORIENTATION=-